MTFHAGSIFLSKITGGLFKPKKNPSKSKVAENSATVSTISEASKIEDDELSLVTSLFENKQSKFQCPSGKSTTYNRNYFLWDLEKSDKSASENFLYERVEDSVEEILNQNLLNKISLQFPLEGLLQKGDNDFYFLKLSDSYLKLLFPLLGDETIKPVSFPMGAHIPVVTCDEAKELDQTLLNSQLGNKFFFTVKRAICIKPSQGNLEAVYGLEVESKTVESLREFFQLPPKICGRDFLIIFAAKMMKNPKPCQELYLRVSPALSQA